MQTAEKVYSVIQMYQSREKNESETDSNHALIFTTLRANSADDKLTIFSLFSWKKGFDISIKIVSLDSNEMSVRIVSKNYKRKLKCRLL